MNFIQDILLELSSLQCFQTLTSVDLKWPLTSTENNGYLVLSNVHPKYQISFWVFMFSSIFLPSARQKWTQNFWSYSKTKKQEHWTDYFLINFNLRYWSKPEADCWINTCHNYWLTVVVSWNPLFIAAFPFVTPRFVKARIPMIFSTRSDNMEV